MASLVQIKSACWAVAHKTARSLVTWPTGREWLSCSALFLTYSALALFLGLVSGILRWELHAEAIGKLARFTAIAFFVPCLSEELLFRAVFLPDPRQPWPPVYRLLRATVALTLFVLWHPVNGLFLKTAAQQLFVDPRFLLLAALLGCCSTMIYLRTRSIWPSTLVHWISLVCWKTFLGGQIF